MKPSEHAHPELHARLVNQPIDINEPAAVDFWLQTLDCSEQELRMAVADVGPLATDVGNQLGRSL